MWKCYRLSTWKNRTISNTGSMILILQCKLRPYKVNVQMNTTSIWMTKHKVLLEGTNFIEGTHGILLQINQLPIIMWFQEHGLSIARGNLIGISRNSRHAIVWEGMSSRDFLLNPWTHIINWSSGPQWGWCLFWNMF